MSQTSIDPIAQFDAWYGEAEAAEPDLGVLLGGFDTAPVSGPDWTFLAEAVQPGDWDEVGNGNPFA